MRDIALSDFVIKYFMTKTLKTYLKTAAKDYKSRSVNPPVVRASTILFKSMQELRKHQKDIAKKKTSNIGTMEGKAHKQQFNYKNYLEGWKRPTKYF